MSLTNMTPKETVQYLNEYVIGQYEAKKTISVALRNRYRRMQLEKSIQDDVIPKNILMIGNTGVGKTEIARRLATMMGLPFIKVEASKYTEVGFVGRDVESMIRDLVSVSINLVRSEHDGNNQDKIDTYVTNRILEKLLPPLPKGASEQKQAEYDKSFEKMEQKLHDGELDERIIEIDVPQIQVESVDSNLPPEMMKVQESLSSMFQGFNKGPKTKEVTIKEAKKSLRLEASHKLIDQEAVKEEALKRVETGGIVFIDEIDKIAVSAKSQATADPSKEGVQRDLLPIVEGSSVTTKHGMVKTDHILFIAAGAFHLSKPSDLIPELQGRFPLRVELDSLTEDALLKILTEPTNSLIKQYTALLKVEDVELVFEDEALKAIAHNSFLANEKTEDIGARRLHTVMEKIIEDVSFEAEDMAGEKYIINKALVDEKLGKIIDSEDITRYIL
ncbi:MAG: HslU--HslV peptidase ATPase subunit [Campylobacterota bacterium]